MAISCEAIVPSDYPMLAQLAYDTVDGTDVSNGHTDIMLLSHSSPLLLHILLSVKKNILENIPVSLSITDWEQILNLNTFPKENIKKHLHLVTRFLHKEYSLSERFSSMHDTTRKKICVCVKLIIL